MVNLSENLGDAPWNDKKQCRGCNTHVTRMSYFALKIAAGIKACFARRG